MAKLEDVILQDTRANQPAANTVAVGTLYGVTDEDNIIERSDGAAWQAYSPTGSGSGDVVGPGSATDNAIVRFDNTTGKLIQNSAVTIADTTGLIAGARFANTGLKLEDTNASHLLTIAPGTNLTADRTFTLTTGDADRSLSVTADSTIAGTAYVAGGTDVAVADGGTNISSYTAGDLLYATGATTLAKLAIGTAGQVLKTNAGATAPEWGASSGSSVVVQVVSTQSGAVQTGTTVIPFDDTIPQNTEGTEFMTLAITPTNSSHKLRIDVDMFAAVTTTPWIAVALFQDSTAGALAATATFIPLSGAGASIPLTHVMTAGTTSSTTFKVRVGPSSAATVTLNGSGGGRIFGGVAASSITITEYVP